MISRSFPEPLGALMLFPVSSLDGNKTTENCIQIHSVSIGTSLPLATAPSKEITARLQTKKLGNQWRGNHASTLGWRKIAQLEGFQVDGWVGHSPQMLMPPRIQLMRSTSMALCNLVRSSTGSHSQEDEKALAAYASFSIVSSGVCDFASSLWVLVSDECRKQKTILFGNPSGLQKGSISEPISKTCLILGHRIETQWNQHAEACLETTTLNYRLSNHSC